MKSNIVIFEYVLENNTQLFYKLFIFVFFVSLITTDSI